MKKSFVIFFILSFCSLYAQDQRDFFRLDCDITHVSFSSAALICAAGTNGVIMRSLDTGATWQQFHTGTGETMRLAAFFSNTTGLAIGAKSTTIRTTNGGKKWTRLELPGNPDFYGMGIQGNSAILTGKNGVVFYSQDQAQSWKASDPFTADSILSVAFSDSHTAIATTGSSKIFRTTDGGKSWTEISHPLSKFKIIGGARKRGDSAIFIPFADGSLTRLSTTYDGGLTWKDSTYQIAAKAMSFTAGGYGLFLSGYNSIYRTTDSSKPAYSAYFDPIMTAPSGSLRFDAIALNDNMTGIATGNLKTLYRTTDGGLTWKLLSYFRTEEKAYLATSVTFINDSVGWVGAYKENLFRTRDGGATWLPQQIHDSTVVYAATITDVMFFDEKHGIISSDNDPRPFYFTDDGGETFLTWNEYFNDTSSTKKPNEGFLQFVDPSFGMIFGKYYLQATTDTGRTWQSRVIPYDKKETIEAGYILDRNTYFFALKRQDKGANGFPEETAKILRTFDGGTTWQTNSLPDMSGPYAMHRFDDGSMIVAGRKLEIDTVTGYKMNNRMYRTTDNFTTVELVEKSDNIYTSDMSFYGDEGYAVQFPRSVLYTGDKGKNWKNVEALKNIAATDVSMPSRNTVYFVNDNSMLVKGILRDTLTLLVEEGTKVTLRPAKEVWMRDAYPNPFSSKIKIDIYYSLSLAKEDISLKVFDTFGKEVANITQNFMQSSGNNPAIVDWNPHDLTNGLYFVQVKGGNTITTIPIVLMR